MFGSLTVNHLDLSKNNLTKVVNEAFIQSKINYLQLYFNDDNNIVVDKTAWGLSNNTISID